MEEIKDNFLEENKLIFKKYKPLKKIGSGSFGKIYSVIRLKDKITFAMKTEKISDKIKYLESESYNLFRIQGGIGIPKLITCGHVKHYNILIETLLDKTLYDIFIKRNKESNLIDICLIGIQIIERLKWIHSKDLVYRDIKPDNFLIGINDPNVIYIIDFGLCKKYRSSKTGRHIFPKLTGQLNGTIKYASPNAIRGKEISRRDDLISLGYMLIYLLKKSLPWKCSVKNTAKYFEIMHQKDTNGDGELFNNIPNEFKDYIKYTRNLKFEQDPDYSYLTSLFLKIISNYNLDYKKITFSWIDEKNKKELLGIPRSLSKRKSNYHIRLYKSIEKEIQDRLKRNLTNKNKNVIIDSDIHKTNKTLKNLEIVPNSNISEIIYSKLNNIKKINTIDKYNFINKNINFNNNKENDYLSLKMAKNKNIKKIPKYKKIRNQNINDNTIEMNNKSEYNSIFNNKNIINKYKIRTLTNINSFKKMPIKIHKMGKINNFHLPTNYMNNNMKKYLNMNYSSKGIFARHKIVEELHLSNNIEYKSPISNKNINNNNLKIDYSTNEIHHFSNWGRYNIDLINKNKSLISSNSKNKTDKIINKNDLNIIFINNNLNILKQSNNIKTRPNLRKRFAFDSKFKDILANL